MSDHVIFNGNLYRKKDVRDFLTNRIAETQMKLNAMHHELSIWDRIEGINTDTLKEMEATLTPKMSVF